MFPRGIDLVKKNVFSQSGPPIDLAFVGNIINIPTPPWRNNNEQAQNSKKISAWIFIIYSIYTPLQIQYIYRYIYQEFFRNEWRCKRNQVLNPDISLIYMIHVNISARVIYYYRFYVN